LRFTLLGPSDAQAGAHHLRALPGGTHAIAAEHSVRHKPKSLLGAIVLEAHVPPVVKGAEHRLTRIAAQQAFGGQPTQLDAADLAFVARAFTGGKGANAARAANAELLGGVQVAPGFLCTEAHVSQQAVADQVVQA